MFLCCMTNIVVISLLVFRAAGSEKNSRFADQNVFIYILIWLHNNNNNNSDEDDDDNNNNNLHYYFY